jgi:hypothetical protein
MLTVRSALLLVVMSFLTACDSPNVTAEQPSQPCLQANAFFYHAENDLPAGSRDWVNLMLAGARLIYATNQCGDRVAGSKENLCAEVKNAMQVFVGNPMVLHGEKRDTAIKTTSLAYEGAECEAALNITDEH